MASKKDREGRDVRTIIANPRDPIYGETSFKTYDIYHPDTGARRDVDAARRELRGLAGHKIRLTVLGERKDKNTVDVIANTRNSTTLTLHRYSDIFGPGGAFLELLKRQIERDSEDIYFVQFIEIEAID
jgi:hypothetical protein